MFCVHCHVFSVLCLVRLIKRRARIEHVCAAVIAPQTRALQVEYETAKISSAINLTSTNN